MKKARDKAKSRGWTLSSVLRALVRLWVDEDVVTAEDVGKESERAPRTKKKAPVTKPKSKKD
jgi:hypothetical protein